MNLRPGFEKFCAMKTKFKKNEILGILILHFLDIYHIINPMFA